MENTFLQTSSYEGELTLWKNATKMSVCRMPWVDSKLFFWWRWISHFLCFKSCTSTDDNLIGDRSWDMEVKESFLIHFQTALSLRIWQQEAWDSFWSRCKNHLEIRLYNLYTKRHLWNIYRNPWHTRLFKKIFHQKHNVLTLFMWSESMNEI